MSRRVQRPPIQGRGYSVRALTSVGGGRTARAAASPRPSPGGVDGADPEFVGRAEFPAGVACDGAAFCCSIGAAIRALATSVKRPTSLCHHPLHAMAPCQKFVYVEL